MFKLENFSLTGRKAIVTGGTRGLCNGIAQAYHDLGAEVVIVGSSALGQGAADRMHTPDAPVHYVACDLKKPDDIPVKFEQCLQKLGGRVDILLNGAGIQHRCPAADFPPEQWNDILAVNLTAAFLMAQNAGRVMIEQQYGKIVNIASMCSFFGSERIPAYSASKGGIAQLTKALSNEWARYGVNVNAIAPGYMATAITQSIQTTDPAQYEQITARIPMRRWGRPEDLQGAAVFLASDASAYLSGAVIPVDGGYLGK